MFKISEIYTTAPEEFKTALQEKTYEWLTKLGIEYERVDTDEAITMEDCVLINKALDMKMVKTLFLCNKKKTEFYIFVTTGSKHFNSKKFQELTGAKHLSFAPEELFEEMLGVKIGAATVFSSIIDTDNKIKIYIDYDVYTEEYYGCSDGTTTCYMKIKTKDIIEKFLPAVNHTAMVVQM